MGLAGALLVFIGLWQSLEWLMAGRHRDTLRLIPLGIVSLVLGVLIVTFTGGHVVLWLALLVTLFSLVTLLFSRKRSRVRGWVIVVFVVCDVLIVVGLLQVGLLQAVLLMTTNV